MSGKHPNRVAAGRKAASKVWPRACPRCGHPFTGTAKQVYCSRVCKDAAAAAAREVKRCGWCETLMPAALARQRWCSDACRKKGRYAAETKECSECSRPFTPARGRAKRLTCSPACATVRDSRLKYLERNPHVGAADLAAKLGAKRYDNPGDPGP